jgi:hypothetical protein
MLFKLVLKYPRPTIRAIHAIIVYHIYKIDVSTNKINSYPIISSLISIKPPAPLSKTGLLSVVLLVEFVDVVLLDVV